MTMNVDRTVVTNATTPVPTATGDLAPAGQVVHTSRSEVTTSRPSGSEMGRRIVLFAFGLIQIVIGARIVLLLLDAREGNGLVSGVLNLSQLFVGPFEGILRTDALRASGSVLDIAAIVALIGWTILEFIVIRGIGIFRREPA
jgi:hypothetical protein